MSVYLATSRDLPNPRNEAPSNELRVDNSGLPGLGLEPIALEQGNGLPVPHSDAESPTSSGNYGTNLGLIMTKKAIKTMY